ncbi:hypothetical protein QTQ03_02020 [Micromonospora sp. WMMA1363]|uniref:hypothetical protein n=1 Tax=Micromonospora sp. WMMA1363 TaxID=3053985 RepID=UPI00259CD801|nr:hypothetical protein [Micromonospora sp. WMMA1363]MDM4718426.1 hypothetical protein [Micromonospora sp. WMMA1363]
MSRDKRVPEKVEGPYQPDTEVTGFEAAFPLRKLAALYIEHGWRVAMDGETLEDVTPEQMRLVVASLIDDMIANQDAAYATGYRLLVLRDNDFPNDLDVYLYVGRATTETETTGVNTA